MNNSGVKGNTEAPQVERELRREKTGSEHGSALPDSTQDSVVLSEPFTGSGKRQVTDASSMGMGNDRIASDHRSDCLISDKNPILDHHRNRADEAGDLDKQKGKQGNVLGTEDGFKMNPNNSVK